MEFSESLRKNRDFQRVYRQGRSAAGRKFIMYVLDNGTDRNRIGISVSKKVGNSVVRHRVRRLIREGYRLQEPLFSRGVDLIVVARPSAAGCTQAEASENLRYLGSRLHIREKKNETRPD